MCGRTRCHGGETNCFSSTCLDVCAECPPSTASQPQVRLSIDGLTRGYEFLVDNALDVGKNDNMDLTLLRTWRAFFGRGEFGDFHCDDCCLVSRVITIHPCLITGYDIGDEVGVVSGLLFEFPADRNAKGFLVVAQQSWHKSCRNASHVQIVRLDGPVWQSYYLTNIVDSLPTICKDRLANFCNVFRCSACRGSSRTLIVVDRLSSVFEAFGL